MTTWTAPAFQFYANDYLSSPRVQRMTLEEEGAYVRLLLYTWTAGSIPDDISELARLCKTTPQTMKKLWGRIQDCFEESAPGQLINPKLEIVRQEQRAHTERRRRAGRQGAEARWRSDGNANAAASESHSERSADAVRRNGSSSSTSSSRKKNPYPTLFQTLWERYPMKDGRKDAVRHFTTTVKTEQDVADIEQALDRYLAHLNRHPTKPPKNGSTWFNNWRDWIDFEEPEIRRSSGPMRHTGVVV